MTIPSNSSNPSSIDYPKDTPLRIYLSAKDGIVGITEDGQRHSTVSGYITKFWDGLEGGNYALFSMKYTFTIIIIDNDNIRTEDNIYTYIGTCKSKADLVNLIPEYFV